MSLSQIMQSFHRKRLRVVELVRWPFMFKLVAMVYLLSLAISWFPFSSSNNLQPTELKNSSWKTMPIHHHRDSDTHRKQMELSSNKITNLYEIMNKQLTGFPKGKFEGKPYKKILYWNTMRNFPPSRKNSNYGVGVGRDRYQEAGCPVWQCETSENRTNLLQYDAILFNQHMWNASDLPKERGDHQRYIFFSYEPPPLRRIFTNWTTYWQTIKSIPFNWTMTYRWDSDVVHPFTYVEPNGSLPLHPKEEEYLKILNEGKRPNYAAGKTKMAAFFESNCPEVTSGRKQLVQQLIQKGIQIDHYGKCGNMSCGHRDFVLDREFNEVESCLQMAEKTYKFFLSFDNSLCLDWMPERFTHALRYSMIPVVMDVHGNQAKLSPPHSFINALDFPSAGHLADYLNLLDKNDTLYNEYFWWRPYYKVHGNIFEGISYKYFCSLCAALHDPEKEPHKVYSDIYQWWWGKSQCHTNQYDGMYVKELDSEKPMF